MPGPGRCRSRSRKSTRGCSWRCAMTASGLIRRSTAAARVSAWRACWSAPDCSGVNSISNARRALEAGASGFVLKHSAAAELLTALRAAVRGKTYITPALAGEVFNAIRQRPKEPTDPGALLTPRQREILQLLVEGQSAKQI